MPVTAFLPGFNSYDPSSQKWPTTHGNSSQRRPSPNEAPALMPSDGSVLVGLLANSIFGWNWADSVAALVIAALAVREGIEAWKSDIESPFEFLSSDDEEVKADA